VAIGPGISRHPETTVFVHGFIRGCPVPFLVDADGLNALSENTDTLGERVSPCVLTPHPGEMGRLTGRPVLEVQAAREEAAAEFAQTHGCVVVLKGQGTVVANPRGHCFTNTTGGHGLATGGTGDVLTGIIGGLLAQGIAPLDAARLGVFVHGLAGDLAAADKTARAMVAGDVIEALPRAWRVIEVNGAAPVPPE
jgi:NAD(P)H-hydrate epimerase